MNYVIAGKDTSSRQFKVRVKFNTPGYFYIISTSNDADQTISLIYPNETDDPFIYFNDGKIDLPSNTAHFCIDKSLSEKFCMLYSQSPIAIKSLIAAANSTHKPFHEIIKSYLPERITQNDKITFNKKRIQFETRSATNNSILCFLVNLQSN